jgi:hypothetical protein
VAKSANNPANPAVVPAEREKPGRKKTECPLSSDEFAGAAKPLPINIDGTTITADVKEFKSGSFGWYCSEKVTVMVGNTPVKVQVGLNMTIVGSKDKAAEKK